MVGDAPGEPSGLADLGVTIEESNPTDSETRARARVRNDFEHAITVTLAMNVLYMYYVDHKLFVLFIRLAQVTTLMYFPTHADRAFQRYSTAFLAVMHVPVLLIHTSMSARGTSGEMILISFLGDEPQSSFKLIYIELLTFVLQTMLLQTKSSLDYRLPITKFPSPSSSENDMRDLPETSTQRETRGRRAL